MSKSHHKNDRTFFPVAGLNDSHMTTADGNTRKQNSQCMNTVLQNMNGN